VEAPGEHQDRRSEEGADGTEAGPRGCGPPAGADARAGDLCELRAPAVGGLSRAPAGGAAGWGVAGWGVAAHAARTALSPAGLSGYHQAYRPEAAGAWALPQAEFGLDVIALVGQLRSREQRSVPQIHQAVRERGVDIAERSVTELLHRSEELVALRLGDVSELRARLAEQGGVILALDGVQPEVGHEVLWVLRAVRSGEVLLARRLLSATHGDVAPLLAEVREALTAPGDPTQRVPIQAVISDGQRSIRTAVAQALPGVPHQLCQFQSLREAAVPIVEADRHATKARTTRVRGVRPIERALEGRTEDAAEVVRGDCLAIRSALTDDGRPPLAAHRWPPRGSRDGTGWRR
jgi:hypothetical protein